MKVLYIYHTIHTHYTSQCCESSLLGFWRTMSEYSFSGAIMISCFLLRMRMNWTSSSGCRDLIAACAFAVNWVINEPYSIVSFWDIVLLMAIPLEFTTMIPFTPLWVLIRLIVSSTFCDYKETFKGFNSLPFIYILNLIYLFRKIIHTQQLKTSQFS